MGTANLKKKYFLQFFRRDIQINLSMSKKISAD